MPGMNPGTGIMARPQRLRSAASAPIPQGLNDTDGKANDDAGH